MIRNLLLLLVLFAASCGKTQGAATGITAPLIAGSQWHGMVFAAVSVDQTVSMARVYYYDFSQGRVVEVFSDGALAPKLFWVDHEVWYFDRKSDESQRLQRFDPRLSLRAPSATFDIRGLKSIDPWSVVALPGQDTSTSTVALAAPGSEALALLSLPSGAALTSDQSLEVEPLARPSTLSAPTLRPISLLTTPSQLLMLHSGVPTNVLARASNDTQIFALTLNRSSLPVYADLKPADATIDGLALGLSNPSSFLNQDGQGGATIVGLCFKRPDYWPGCKPGAYRLRKGLSLVAYNSAILSGLGLANQIIDGPSDDVVYAHVQTADNNFAVMRVDLAAQTTSTVHVFTDQRLYGIAYDRSTHTLFVGGVSGLSGSMTLYQDDRHIGTFELEGVPFSSTFVPNG